MGQESISLLQTQCAEIEDSIWADYIDPLQKCDPIIDGIVNIEKYLDSGLKILWILKEPYDDVQDGAAAGGGWHFANDFLSHDDFYRKMGRSHTTWHPIIYVSYGILNNFVLWNDMNYIRDDPGMTEIVRHIAVINVKKLPGFTRTYSYGPISEAYNKNKLLLLKQIEIYNPDIIIGGSTLPLFYNDLGIDKAKEENKFGCIEFVEKHKKLFISAYHPAQTQVTRERYVNDIIVVAKSFRERLH